jgi:hypothetical protein
MVTMLRPPVSLCVATVVAFTLMARPAAAQQTPESRPLPAPPSVASARPFEILDNSFLVEEAFNQEAGVVQNIVGFLRAGSSWGLGFTQEWPLRNPRHQLSYSVPLTHLDGATGVGDVQVHYRWQATTEGPGRPAFSPRFSFIFPTGDPDRGTGDGVAGWQFNLPFSKQAGDLYFHWNAGLTILPQRAAGPTTEVTLTSPAVAGSVIWRLAPMFNVLLEHTYVWAHEPEDTGATSRTGFYTFSPGLRGGWNAGDAQIILGIAAPVTWGGGSTETAAFLYFSYELPFRK